MYLYEEPKRDKYISRIGHKGDFADKQKTSLHNTTIRQRIVIAILLTYIELNVPIDLLNVTILSNKQYIHTIIHS